MTNNDKVDSRLSRWFSIKIFPVNVSMHTLTSFAVGQSFLQEERAIAEEFAAIGAVKAFRVEVLSNRVQAVLDIEGTIGEFSIVAVVVDDSCQQYSRP